MLAANVDTIFVVTALDDDFSPRRIERYLTLAWESGASPALVLTKADLCDDPLAALLEAEQVARRRARASDQQPHRRRASTSSRRYLVPAQTVALLGSSGVGKSSLANRLLGHEAQPTKELAEDGTGRHTTTARQLIRLPSGALLVDTPGLREVQLWDADEGIDQAFADVDDLAAGCRFNDCAHEQEPGCAVQEAIGEGRLPRERLDSYRALQRELQRLAAKQDARLRAEEKRERVAFASSLRKSAW